MKFFIRGDGAFVKDLFGREDFTPCPSFKQASDFLFDKYGAELEENPHHTIGMMTGLRNFFEILEYLRLEGFKEKSFLDLGCGCDPPNDYPGHPYRSSEYSNNSNYPHKPWLARSMHHLGFRTIGVDKGPLDKEPFEHYSRDLMIRGSLDMIASGSIDIVHSHLLDCSPTLGREYGESAGELSGILFPEINRVLRDGGYCISDISFKELEKLKELKVKVV